MLPEFIGSFDTFLVKLGGAIEMRAGVPIMSLLPTPFVASSYKLLCHINSIG
jgi:hypothetical protein